MYKSALALLLLTVAAPAAAQPASAVGRTFHYERSNRDGSEPEQIYMHRATPWRIEVYKMVERCTRAAFVAARIDPATGEARELEAGKLLPNAEHDNFATLMDQQGALVLVTGDEETPPHPVTARVATRPWHLYDYDLATLSAGFAARAGSRADLRFGMALFWEDPARPDELVHWLGEATARFAAAERHEGRDTLRFEVTGPAFGEAGGGPLWIDAREGHIVDVQWGRPNHKEYKDFRLRLVGEEPAGLDAWTALLTRHYAGCEPSGGTSAP